MFAVGLTRFLYSIDLRNQIPGIFSGFNIMEQFQIVRRNGPFVDQCIKIDNPFPERFTKQHDRNRGYLVGLNQGKGLKKFIQGSKTTCRRA